ncbi:MAG: hypothetical protein AAF770_01865 [Bacteroidota bacterium]
MKYLCLLCIIISLTFTRAGIASQKFDQQSIPPIKIPGKYSPNTQVNDQLTSQLTASFEDPNSDYNTLTEYDEGSGSSEKGLYPFNFSLISDQNTNSMINIKSGSQSGYNKHDRSVKSSLNLLNKDTFRAYEDREQLTTFPALRYLQQREKNMHLAASTEDGSCSDSSPSSQKGLLNVAVKEKSEFSNKSEFIEQTAINQTKNSEKNSLHPNLQEKIPDTFYQKEVVQDKEMAKSEKGNWPYAVFSFLGGTLFGFYMKNQKKGSLKKKVIDK